MLAEWYGRLVWSSSPFTIEKGSGDLEIPISCPCPDDQSERVRLPYDITRGHNVGDTVRMAPAAMTVAISDMAN